MTSKAIRNLEIGVAVGRSKAGFTLSGLDMSARLANGAYETRLKELQYQLRAVEIAYYRQGRRALIVFEGWDAAGKGGAIRRMTAELDPRFCKVWPIGPPTPDEQGRHYLYRFVQRLPVPGQMAIFDRSWYGRVLVERVEKLTPKHRWKRAYGEINGFERALVDDGARLVKIFLHITADEQLDRFEKRLRDPYKRWKMTRDDFRNRIQWDEYEAAILEMIDRTSAAARPWNVIPGNDKKYARIQAMQVVRDALSEGVEIEPPPLDPELERLARDQLGIS